jgi:hypothetical protein
MVNIWQRSPLLGESESLSPTPSYPRIGLEKIDPPFQAGLPGCPVNKVCQWADAVFVEDISNGAFRTQTLARPVNRDRWGQSSGPPIQINSMNPTLSVSWDGGVPMENQELDKIGITSGWTFGPVKWPCRNWVNQDNSNQVYLCQDGVNTGVQGGDSGGPVFEWFGEGVKAYGISIGRSVVDDNQWALWLSSMTNIRQDLGILWPHW